jgi:hypothetical protein
VLRRAAAQRCDPLFDLRLSDRAVHHPCHRWQPSPERRIHTSRRIRAKPAFSTKQSIILRLETAEKRLDLTSYHSTRMLRAVGNGVLV